MKFFDRFKRGYTSKKDEAKREAERPKATVPAKTGADVPAPVAGTGDAYRVLVHPIVSEKSARLESIGQYVFAVGRRANKVEIKKAIEGHYRVHVERVNVMNVPGKSVRFGRTSGTRSDWRKAYVTLKKGERITF